jgi:hypothetical protein
MMLIGYTAKNKKTGEKVDFFAVSSNAMMRGQGLDAHNWIVNHLDTSYEWNYNPNGKFKIR